MSPISTSNEITPNRHVPSNSQNKQSQHFLTPNRHVPSNSQNTQLLPPPCMEKGDSRATDQLSFLQEFFCSSRQVTRLSISLGLVNFQVSCSGFSSAFLFSCLLSAGFPPLVLNVFFAFTGFRSCESYVRCRASRDSRDTVQH